MIVLLAPSVVRLWLRRHLLLVLLGLCMSGTACIEERATPPLSAPDHATAALMGLAQSHHERADIALERGELDGAVVEMEALVQAVQTHDTDAGEVKDLGLDAYGRLARLQADRGQVEQALRTAEAGLAFGGAQATSSLFAGYLHQIRGDMLRKMGDDRGAVAAHKDAILVFKGILERPAAEATP